MGWAAIIVASITVVGQAFTAVLVILLRRFVAPPSGNTLGEVAERSHHLAAVNTAALKAVVEHTEGVDWNRDVDGAETGEPPAAKGE